MIEEWPGTRRGLVDHLRFRARQMGLPPAQLTRRVVVERLLGRVFHDEAEGGGWVLKGATVLLVRYETARHSRDIDLAAGGGPGRLDEAIGALVTAAAIDLRDGFRFRMTNVARRAGNNQSATATVSFAAEYRGDAQPLDAVPVDLTVGMLDVVPEIRRPVPTLGLAGDTLPALRLWPVDHHIADKICAMYEIHPPDRTPSSRFKDLVDLVLIGQQEPSLDLDAIQVAVAAEARRRDLLLPNEFRSPGPAWPDGYRKAADDAHLPTELRSLESALSWLSDLIGSVLPR